MNRLKLLIAALAAAPAVLTLLLLERMRWALHLRRPLSGKGSETGPLLFSYSQVLWDDVWQRPQEHAWRTAARRPVVFCAPVQLHNWLRTLRGRWRPVAVHRRAEYDLVILSPLVFSGHFKSRRIFELNCRLIAAHARPWLRQAASIDCVTNTPYGVPVIERLFGLGARRSSLLRTLTYDVIDDFTAFDWSPAFGRELDVRLMREADVVLTGTWELRDQRAAVRPETEFIPCGVDFDAFHRPAPEPEDLRGLPRPLIGYFGTISDRLDLELLDKVASSFPHGTLVMVGPVHLPDHILPRGAGNVRYLGLKPHDALPGYAQAFDVGLIPFRLTEATLKLNPVKTLEYLAAGLPVVSTAIPDVMRFFSDAVLVAADHDEFMNHIARCLTEPDTTRQQAGVELARRASWEEMTRRMNEIIDQAVRPSLHAPAADRESA